MSVQDSGSHSRVPAGEPSVYRRYSDEQTDDVFDLKVEVSADGRSTDVELELPDQADDVITAPYDPSKIDIQTHTLSVGLLMSRLSNGMIDLAPDFQRKAGIWSDAQQSRLIESLLLRIPIPSFYVAEINDSSWVEDSSWAIVDGIQRLTAVARFINPTALTDTEGLDDEPLRLTGLEYLQDNFEGKGYADLTGRLQVRLNEAQVVVHVIRPGTPEAVKFNIFARINTGGLPLTRQEIRHALIPGPARAFLASMAASEAFVSATGGRVSSARMADREMVLRFIAFTLSDPQDFRSQDFDQFLAQAMHGINRLDSTRRSELASAFHRSMRLAQEIFGEHAFRKLYPWSQRRSPVNKALFEAIGVNLAKMSPGQAGELVASREEVVAAFTGLMSRPDFDRAVSVGTGDRRNVRLRFDQLRNLFVSFAGDAEM